MSCKQIRGKLSVFLDGELPLRERRALEEHLEGCQGCAGYYERMSSQQKALEELADLPLPDASSERAVLRWRTSMAAPSTKRTPLPAPRWYHLPVPLVATAVLLFALVRLSPPPDYSYHKLSPDRLRVLQNAEGERRLKYRMGVLLTELRNRPDAATLRETKKQVVRGQFLEEFARIERGRAPGLPEGSTAADSRRQLEVVLLSIVNEDPDFPRLAAGITFN